MNQTPNLIEKIITDRKVRAAVTRRSHEWFFSIYLAHYVQCVSAPFQRELFRLTEDLAWKLLCVVAFRGSGKSTIFTTSYALWSILGVQQKKFVIIFCQTKGQAKQHMMNLRQELENNALLKTDLGPFKEERDTEWGASSLVFSRSQARITVASTEQSIRGLRHKQHRPDLVICDDVEDLASTNTQEGRDKTYQWFTGDMLPAGDMNTRVVVVGNLLHDDSLLMRLKNDIETKARNGVFRQYPLLDENGTVLWPGKYPSAASIEEQKQIVGNESSWQREFLLRIITNEDQIILPEWIQYYDTLPHDGPFSDFRFSATGIDLAISEKATADCTAMVSARIYGRGQNLRIYILPNPVNERLDFPKTVERAMGVSRSLGNGIYTKLYIENVGYQQALIDHLKAQHLPAEEFKTLGQDKRARLTLTATPIQSGAVLFPRQGADLLIRQLIGFGKERHDDLADAFAIVVLKALAANTDQFFTNFNINAHVIEPCEIPPRWFLYRSIVPMSLTGSACCLWFAVDTKSCAYVIREYFDDTGLDAAMHAERIRKKSEVVAEVPEGYQFTVMDPRAFTKFGAAESMLELYAKHEIYVSFPGEQDPAMGWDAVKRRLRLNERGEPMLKIFNNCPHLIKALSSLSPNPSNLQDVDQSMETAPVDCLRFCLQVLRDTKAPIPKTAVEERLEWFKNQRDSFDY